MLNTKPSRTGSIVSIVVSIVLLSVAVLAVVNRQYVFDQVTVWQYQPSQQLRTMSERAALADKGEFYLYASQPEVTTAAQFNAACTRQESGSAILGCYTNGRIYVYDVPNDELDGVEEVTIAHEMLHAAWERTSAQEKTRLSGLLETAYAGIDDDELDERLDYYARTEPGERANELHSILATEYTTIGSELETYYAQYFEDRSKVVSLHQGYESVFDTLRQQSDALSGEMAVLKQRIDEQTATYNTEAAAITQAIDDLQAEAAAIDRSNVAAVNAYNAKRQQVVARIDALNLQKDATNADVALYNEKVKQFNTLVTSVNKLSESLDSTLTETPDL